MQMRAKRIAVSIRDGRGAVHAACASYYAYCVVYVPYEFCYPAVEACVRAREGGRSYDARACVNSRSVELVCVCVCALVCVAYEVFKVRLSALSALSVLCILSESCGGENYQEK